MNREQTKALLPIIKAFAEGKMIQRRCITDETSLWWDENNPTFEVDTFDYRIKPELQYRAFRDSEECWNEMLKHQPFGWVKSKNNSSISKFMIITRMSDEDICIDSCVEDEYNAFLEDYVFADGTPFGVLD